MAPNLVPSALAIPWLQRVRLLPSTGTNAATCALGGFTNTQTNPTKVFAVIVCNNDTITHDIQIGILDAAGAVGFMPLGTVNIPINAGYIGSIPSVNLLAGIAALPVDETGQSYLFMQKDDQLQVKCLVAINAGKEIDVIVQGADF